MMKFMGLLLVLSLTACFGMVGTFQSFTYSLASVEDTSKKKFTEYDNFLPVIELDDSTYLWITPAEGREVIPRVSCEFYRSGIYFGIWNKQPININLKASYAAEMGAQSAGRIFWVKNYYDGAATVSPAGDMLYLPAVSSSVLEPVMHLLADKKKPDNDVLKYSNRFMMKFESQNICSDKSFYLSLTYTNGAGAEKKKIIYFSPLVFIKLSK